MAALVETTSWEEHPNLKHGKATDVECLVRLVDINEINTPKSYADIKLLIWYFWHDPRLAGESANCLLPASLWRPRFNLEGTRIGDLHESVKLFRHTGNGDLVCMMRYAACINDPMDLTPFPFDIDELGITLSANTALIGDSVKGCVNGELKEWRPSLKGYYVAKDTMAIPDWDVVGYRCNEVQGGAFDKIQLNVQLERNTAYYMFKIIVPLVVITLMSFLGFSMSVSAVNDRVAHSSSLLLATVGLLYVVSVEVPKTKYQTVVDKVILLTMLMLAITAMHAVFERFLESFELLKVTSKISIMTAGAYFVLYITVLGCIFIPAWRSKRNAIHHIEAFDKEQRKHCISGYKVAPDEWRTPWWDTFDSVNSV